MIWTLIFSICAPKVLALKTILFDNGEILRGDFGFILEYREILLRGNHFYSPFPEDLVTINEFELQATMKRRYEKIFLFDKLVPISHFKRRPPTLDNVQESEFQRGKFYSFIPIFPNSPKELYHSRIESEYAINISAFTFPSKSNTSTITNYKTNYFDLSWCMFFNTTPTPLIHQPIRCCNEILIILAELKNRGLAGNYRAPLFKDAIAVGRDRMDNLLFKLVVPAVVGCKIDDFVLSLQAFKANFTNTLQFTQQVIDSISPMNTNLHLTLEIPLSIQPPHAQ